MRAQAAIPIGEAQSGQYGSPELSSGWPVSGESQISEPSASAWPQS